MKIGVFIVTYNNPSELDKTLGSLFKSCYYVSESFDINISINIINNHSNFSIRKEFESKVNILHNVLRPDFSTGYLTRNWNQALLLGFENLNNPKNHIVIGAQDDTLFNFNWLENLLSLHKKGYSFITYGWGDNFMSWTPDGVKKIGLFDERFMFSGVTSDYFLKALKFNKLKSSINDYHHKRVLNEEKFLVAERPKVKKLHNEERKLHKDYGHNILHHKWSGIKGFATNWDKKFINNCPATIQSPQYIMYPYFENSLNLTTLKEQYQLI